MSFNKICIVGNLGKDPELRYTPQGNAVANLSVATTEKRRAKDGEFENVTTWFRVTLWGNQAENASKYLSKGSAVYIDGTLRVEEWTDKDGNNRHTLEVNGRDMQFIGGGNNSSNSGSDEDEAAVDEAPVKKAPAKAKAATAAAGKKAPVKKQQEDEEDDDIPF